MNIWGIILKIAGWSVDITAPRHDKCVICVAPHTSNWDFILGLSAYKSLGRNANFLMKKFWFFFPLKYLIRSLGGIPVDQAKGRNLTESIIRKFETVDYMNLAVTPEGTRSRTEKWRTGFLYIAAGAHVPVQLGIIDYRNRHIIIRDEFMTTGDVEKDMAYVKSYYARFGNVARYPDKFAL